MPKVNSIDDLKAIKEKRLKERDLKNYRAVVTVHMGTCGEAAGSKMVLDVVRDELQKAGADDVLVLTSGCAGFCSREPMMTVQRKGHLPVKYVLLDEKKTRRIVQEHILEGNAVKEYALVQGYENQFITGSDSLEPEPDIPMTSDIPYFKYQQLIALQNKGLINPEDIEDYISRDGYFAAAKALLEMGPEDIIKEVKSSGLRGRGGAGFPTGLKWELCAKVSSPIKYILCNGDEGDPGAYMDRSIMEGDPHVVLEGMLIGARAIGASQGYIYVRAEYPLAVKMLQKAIEQARQYGLLGENILGSGFNFDIEIYRGAGAFVCGEETALMRSIEGKRGMPIPRPPFPVVKGLWEKPTVLNNVETYANIPKIILKGSSWYRQFGTEQSAGTKVFALTGAVNNVGLIEVPMGIPLKQVIEEIGGGMKRGRTFKAVQLGGPSGGCVPSELLDTPVTYEDIVKTGAIVGSGGMVVMDDLSCMVNVARFFLEFTAEESCGKCPPCRIGTRVLLDKLIDITEGRGREGDIELLEDLAREIIKTSLCGLGQTAPNPVLTTIRYFRHEYEEHIKDKYCRSGVCRSLCTFYIDPEKCTGCTVCARNCPVQAITGEKKKPHVIDQSICIKCRTCYEKCKFGAIEIGPRDRFKTEEVSS